MWINIDKHVEGNQSPKALTGDFGQSQVLFSTPAQVSDRQYLRSSLLSDFQQNSSPWKVRVNLCKNEAQKSFFSLWHVDHRGKSCGYFLFYNSAYFTFPFAHFCLLLIKLIKFGLQGLESTIAYVKRCGMSQQKAVQPLKQPHTT